MVAELHLEEHVVGVEAFSDNNLSDHGQWVQSIVEDLAVPLFKVNFLLGDIISEHLEEEINLWHGQLNVVVDETHVKVEASQ